MPNYWIDIEQNGQVIGNGPITTVSKWEQTFRLDRAGTFSFEMTAADPRAALVQPKRVARCHSVVNGRIQEIGAGIIDTVNVKPLVGGEVQLVVSGDDLLRELTYRSVGFLEVLDDEGPSDSALTDIAALAPPGWSLDTTNGHNRPLSGVYARYGGETVLKALVRMAEQKGEHFRLGQGRTIVWLQKDAPASGLRAIQGHDPIALEQNDHACLIRSLEETADSYDLVSRVYPFGAGNGKARLDLSHCTRTAPTGYVFDKANNFISRTATEAQYGRIEKYVSFKDIAPINNSDLNMESAANALFEAALQYLDRHSQPQKSYSLTVAKLKQTIYPGQTIRVIYRRFFDDYKAVDIDADLRILETKVSYDQDGQGIVGLQVSTIDKPPASDSELQAQQLEQAKLMDAHPQMNMAYAPVGPYTRRLGVNHPTTFTVRIGKEVVALSYAILRFRTGPLRSSTESLAGGGGTTRSSGSSSTATTRAGGGITKSSGPSSTSTTESGGLQAMTAGPSTNTTTAEGGLQAMTAGPSTNTTSTDGGAFLTSNMPSSITTTQSGGLQSMTAGPSTNTTSTDGGAFLTSNMPSSIATTESGGLQSMTAGASTATTSEEGTSWRRVTSESTPSNQLNYSSWAVDYDNVNTRGNIQYTKSTTGTTNHYLNITGSTNYGLSSTYQTQLGLNQAVETDERLSGSSTGTALSGSYDTNKALTSSFDTGSSGADNHRHRVDDDDIEHRHEVDDLDHDHTIPDLRHKHSLLGLGHQHNLSGLGHQHTVTASAELDIANHKHEIEHFHTVPPAQHTHNIEHTHNFQIPTHTHGMDHTHTLNIAAHSHNIEHTHNFQIPAHTHGMDHTHTLNIAAHSHNIEHTHNFQIPAHTHQMDHTHNFQIPAHTHGMDHTHTLNLPDHTHNMAHTHTLTLPNHVHAINYGIYQDNQYPSQLRLLVNGQDVTTALGGPWGGSGEAEAELDLTPYLTAGTLRQNHRLEFQAGRGQGEIEVEVSMFVAVQAIAIA